MAKGFFYVSMKLMCMLLGDVIDGLLTVALEKRGWLL